ncbi:uncharacterized protein LOC111223612 [Seriola dumerili]|uniref:uncharacterized protein LOC111223612 n=1 Tax=Seriola dumerili TaxID=41447 RepID=UPI000BBE7BF9|nr:uncharacterized protein LOC111223612 [Seriola dumerili]XP_022603550.1 uncharacterized protein LOC111223612 [Seriola dumerili]
MIWILLLVGLSSSVCGVFGVKMPLNLCQAEEHDNIIIRWDIQTKADLSLANLVCFLLSKPLKVLYQTIDGVEDPESQHQQFAGRAHCDRDALREGRVTLHVSRVTAQDSGNYWCYLAANYDSARKRWSVEASEHLVLSVTQTSHGESGDVSLTSPKLTEGTDDTAGDPVKEAVRSEYWRQVRIAFGLANVAVLIFAGLVCLLCAATEFIHCDRGRSRPSLRS